MLVPNDVMVEILSRLPAKSLIRLRWSCKYWFDLLTRDADFIKMHLHRSTTHDELFNIISLSALHTSYNNSRIFQCYLNYNNTTRVVDVDHQVSSCFGLPLPLYYSPGCSPTIMGSCNGLIFLFNIQTEDMCIWNPCTKEYRVLPRPLNREPSHRTRKYNYGFGYDHINDDYKVIRIRIYEGGYVQLELYNDVQVYTLSTKAWRWIKPNPYRLNTPDFSPGRFLNGVLYWVDCLYHNIISFEFGTEKFQHVSTIVPGICGHDHDHTVRRIQVFDGSLCMVLNIKYKPQELHEEIWMMNVNAVNNNNNNEYVLTKVLRIPNLYHFPNLYHIEPPPLIHPWVELLRCIGNGDILMLGSQRVLVLYDRKSNNAKILCKNICKEDRHFVIQVYIESLVSLNSGTYTV